MPNEHVSFQQFYNAWKKVEDDKNSNNQVDPQEAALDKKAFELLQSKSAFKVHKEMVDPAAYDNASPPGEF
jgi:hypothetical protein